MRARVIQTLADLSRLSLAEVADRPEPRRVLMCAPDYYDVVDVKNIHMEGNVGAVDKQKARDEWEQLCRAYRKTGHEVLILEGVEGLEDMVFAANQTLPGMGADGRAYVLLSRMLYGSRRREVAHYRAWFERQGYRIYELADEDCFFEGQGDGIWHPGKQLLWGGYGQRTSLCAYSEVSTILDVSVIALKLPHPSFYHLDTCFCVLASDAVMIYPGAFTAEGRGLISSMFRRVIEVSEREAERYFACNAHAIDGRTVIMQRGASEAVYQLRRSGFKVIEVETGEYMKSGGSVFCLKMMIY